MLKGGAACMRSLHGFDGSFDNVKDNITGSISEERKTREFDS